MRDIRVAVLVCTALLACRNSSTPGPADVEQLPRDGISYFPTATAWRTADANAEA